jgi:tocopherol cyclase
MLPHQGYHYNSSINTRFFEGWYYRISIPELQQSFAFMYAIDDPQGNTPVSGGSVQILGIDDAHLWRTLPNSSDFYAAYDRFYLEHWGKQNRDLEGYSASDRHNRGKIYDPLSQTFCTWDYQIKSIHTWGRAQPTMGIWSYFSVFEPGWQILATHALASGSITWQNQTYSFQNAPAYSEKNWGRSFPSKWFWIQANSFNAESFIDPPELAITAAGGIRQYLGQSSQVAMISLFYQGQFYRFMPDSSTIDCQIQPWGSWQICAVNPDFEITLSGYTDQSGEYIMVPTAKGLSFDCRDTGQGNLSLDLKERNGKQIIKAESTLAALEIGGKDWQTEWNFTSAKI